MKRKKVTDAYLKGLHTTPKWEQVSTDMASGLAVFTTATGVALRGKMQFTDSVTTERRIVTKVFRWPRDGTMREIREKWSVFKHESRTGTRGKAAGKSNQALASLEPRVERAWVDRGLSHDSVRCYRVGYKALLEHFGRERTIQSITVPDLIELKERYPAGTYRYALRCFRDAWEVLEVNREIQGVCPALAIPRTYQPKRARRRREYIKAEDLPEFKREVIDKMPEWEPNLLEVILLAGLRPGELLNATWEQVDLENGTLTLEHHKTVNHMGTKVVALPPPAISLLSDIPRHWHNPLMVYGASHKTFARHFRKVTGGTKFAGLQLRDLRRTFATLANQNSVQTEVIQGQLGHTNKATTESVYMAASNNALSPAKRQAIEAHASSLSDLLKGGPDAVNHDEEIPVAPPGYEWKLIPTSE